MAIENDNLPSASRQVDQHQSFLVDSFTLLAWIKPHALNIGTKSAVVRQRGGNEESPGLYIINDKIVYEDYFGKNTNNTRVTYSGVSPSTLTTGFQQIAVTYSHTTGSFGVDNSDYESTLKFYHNDNLVFTQSQNICRDQDDRDALFQIGGAHFTSVQSRLDGGSSPGYAPFAGEIAVVGAYSITLSQAQIADNYNRLRGRFGV